MRNHKYAFGDAMGYALTSVALGDEGALIQHAGCLRERRKIELRHALSAERLKPLRRFPE